MKKVNLGDRLRELSSPASQASIKLERAIRFADKICERVRQGAEANARAGMRSRTEMFSPAEFLFDVKDMSDLVSSRLSADGLTVRIQEVPDPEASNWTRISVEVSW